MIMEFRGHGGVMHFGIFEGKGGGGGLKYGSRPSVGTDIFWNRPLSVSPSSVWIHCDEGLKIKKLCSSRKYPYSPPPPLKKVFCFAPSPPQKIPV